MERLKMNELLIDAKVENLDKVLEFLNSYLEEAQCPAKIQIQMEIAVEEIFVNIAQYAYEPEKTGKALINLENTDSSRIVVQFTDWGTPYNPLEKEDPDITLSAEDREIGGLGIYMVKKSMDHIWYKYEDGKNILSIEKCFESKKK